MSRLKSQFGVPNNCHSVVTVLVFVS